MTPLYPPESGTSTPGPHDDPLSFTPARRAIQSFDNLVALANYQERLREARKMVWRDRGEPVVELYTLQDCIKHAAAGGFRSGALAFTLRAMINTALALVRIRKVKPRAQRLNVIFQALFGKDTFQFAAMFGTFVSTYKFLLNALPLYIPAINPASMRYRSFEASPFDDEQDKLEAGQLPRGAIPAARRQHRLSLSAHAQLVLVRKKTRRWHAALAGAIAGGLAITCENSKRRNVIAQQLFVRGLQGSYNSVASRTGFKVPHGEVLLFSLACGQIMYAWLMRPEALGMGYANWISQASKVPVAAPRIHRQLLGRESFNGFADIDKIVSRKDITPENVASLLELRTLLSSPKFPGAPEPYIPSYVPCAAVHPALNSCRAVPVDRFVDVAWWIMPVYTALHFIPMVLFKRKSFMKDPSRMLGRASIGTLRSSAFLGAFVVIYQSIFCWKHQMHAAFARLPQNALLRRAIPQWLIQLLVSRASYALTGFATGLALFVEERRRRGELAMYVLPKALESAWMMARGKGWAPKTRGVGDVMLTAAGMGMVMSAYQNDPQHLSGLVRRILYQFIGPN
ncbi:hypothetical protein BD626DRAFT_395126 [Schizophyllum amplum]|uniref:Transmembrane protein 135 N-terminal domain-containing protein n=1 Tax=Schizophyllum amplum TaxID=97359 RepID=A0A550CRK6_9AGAR|nr:hypothetical protein BD626DRAFT_395126 [Auriculariopsis ampla]